jgi:hypothetical protein
LDKLLLTPTQAGYGVTHAENTIATRLSGGLSKVRLDQVGGASSVNVSWTLTGHEYQYLMAFYRTTIQHGSLKFLCDLILGSAELQEHTCLFLPGTLTLSSQQGDAYVVRAQLEVEPTEVDEEFDQAIVDLFQEYQPAEAGHELLEQLEQLANEDLAQPALQP